MRVNFICCTTGKIITGDSMAISHGNQSDCCKKGKMATGKTGEMSAADKLTCCLMAGKKSTQK